MIKHFAEVSTLLLFVLLHSILVEDNMLKTDTSFAWFVSKKTLLALCALLVTICASYDQITLLL